MNDDIVGGLPKQSAAGVGRMRASTTAPLRIKAYLGLMLLIPLAFLASAIPIVRSSTFSVVAEDPFLLNPDYAFSLKHADCDVVIVGDSTAVTGLDPTVVAKITGLKTCNIAQSRSAIEILGMLALDTYLENTRPPRYIIMQFAPETLARDRSDLFWPEGLTLVLRREPLLKALPVLLLHPVQSYHFAMWAIKRQVRALQVPPTDFGATEVLFQERGGLLVLPKPPETHCVNLISYGQPSASWSQELKRKYSLHGTRVIMNVSPLPECAPKTALLAKSLNGVTDNQLSLYPIRLFCDLDRHLTLEGADRASIELAHQLILQMTAN